MINRTRSCISKSFLNIVLCFKQTFKIAIFVAPQKWNFNAKEKNEERKKERKKERKRE